MNNGWRSVSKLGDVNVSECVSESVYDLLAIRIDLRIHAGVDDVIMTALVRQMVEDMEEGRHA